MGVRESKLLMCLSKFVFNLDEICLKFRKKSTPILS